MKKIITILFIITLPLLAQGNKGRISLVYNEEKFDLPITQIVVRKENSLMISVRAERSDSLGLQSVSLEFSLSSLAKDEKVSSQVEPRLAISSQVGKDRYGKRFTFNYGPKDAAIEMYYGNDRLNWSSPSFQFKFDAVDITHSNEGLKIKGSFSGKFISTPQGIQSKTMAEIKDGKFEIIL
jgi:hypothetical protein